MAGSLSLQFCPQTRLLPRLLAVCFFSLNQTGNMKEDVSV